MENPSARRPGPRPAAIGALLALAVLLVALAWRSRPSGEGAVDALSAAAEAELGAEADAPRAQERDAAELEAPGAVRTDAAESVASEGSAESEPAPARDGDLALRARVRGRLIDRDGAPIAGVQLELRPGGPGDELTVQLGTRIELETSTGTSHADGRFEVAFRCAPETGVSLGAEKSGFALVSWSLEAFARDEERDLGELTLGPAARVHIRLVGAGGRAPGGTWTALCQQQPPRSAANRTYLNRFLPLDPVGGDCTWDTAPPGEVMVSVMGPAGTATPGPATCTLRAGEVKELVFTYQGAAPGGLLVVDLRRNEQRVYPRPEHVRLFDEEDRPLELVPTTPGRTTYAFHGLEARPHRVLVDDPDFERFECKGLLPGGPAVKGEARPATTIVLELVDERGEVLALPYTLYEWVDPEGYAQPIRRLLHARLDPLPDGELRGLDPGFHDLEVVVEGHFPVRVPVAALAPRELHRARVVLVRGASVAGVVRTADGDPAPGALVRLLKAAEIDDHDGAQVVSVTQRVAGSVGMFRFAHARAISDAQGAFELVGCPAGSWLVQAEVAGGTRSRSVSVDLVPPARYEGVVLELPATASVRGRFTGDPGTSFRGLSVCFVACAPGAPSVEGLGGAKIGGRSAVLDPDGGFALADLPAGAHDVFLATQRTMLGGSWSRGATYVFVERIALGAGDSELAPFDLGPEAPREFALRVLAAGEPVAGAIVVAQRDLPRTLPAQEVAATLHDGRVTLGPLFSGEWKLALERAGESIPLPDLASIVVGPELPSAERVVRLP